MTRYRWLLRLTGVVLFLAILYFVDVSRILTYLRRADPWLVALSVLLVVPHLLTKSWRWLVLLRSVGIRIGFAEACRLYAVGQAAGFLTPGQAGDAVKAVYLKAEGHGLGRSLVTVVVDRLFDLAVVGGLSVWGIFVFGQAPLGQAATIALFVLGVIVFFALFTTDRWHAPLAHLIARLIPQRILGRRDPLCLFKGLVMPPGALLSAFVITLLSFVVSYLRNWLLFAALGLYPSLDQFVAASSIVGIAAVLPVTIAGLGTRDAALIALLAQMGYAGEQGAALAVALSTLLLLLQVVNWVVGFVAFELQPGTAAQASDEKETTDSPLLENGKSGSM